MLRPAGSLTVMSLGSGAWGFQGSKVGVRGSVGSFDCGKSRSTARPAGWSAWTGPPPGCSGLVAIDGGLNWEARGRVVAAGDRREVVLAVFQAGSARSGRPLGRGRCPAFSQESAASFQVGSASEQSTGLERKGRVASYGEPSAEAVRFAAGRRDHREDDRAGNDPELEVGRVAAFRRALHVA